MEESIPKKRHKESRKITTQIASKKPQQLFRTDVTPQKSPCGILNVIDKKIMFKGIYDVFRYCHSRIVRKKYEAYVTRNKDGGCITVLMQPPSLFLVI